MIKSFSALLFIMWLSTGCSGNASRALYEGIKTQNEISKTPAERAMNPSPSYDSYSNESLAKL